MEEEHPIAYHETVLTKLARDVEKHDARLNAVEKAAAVRDEQIRNLFIAVGRFEAKIDVLMGKPAKRWESTMDTLLKLGLGAIITYIATQVFGK